MSNVPFPCAFIIIYFFTLPSPLIQHPMLFIFIIFMGSVNRDIPRVCGYTLSTKKLCFFTFLGSGASDQVLAHFLIIVCFHYTVRIYTRAVLCGRNLLKSRSIRENNYSVLTTWCVRRTSFGGRCIVHTNHTCNLTW